jgi:hypothetical protein
MELTRSYIINLLETNDKAIGRALVALYNRQTEDEQDAEYTKHLNGVGFSGCDGVIGSSMAKYYIRNGYLTTKQLQYWRKPNKKGIPRITKYANQLLTIAIEKQKK